MSTVVVNSATLRELLNAAARTAQAHRDTEAECYVLGQLEATANLAYILVAGSGDVELAVPATGAGCAGTSLRAGKGPRQRLLYHVLTGRFSCRV